MLVQFTFRRDCRAHRRRRRWAWESGSGCTRCGRKSSCCRSWGRPCGGRTNGGQHTSISGMNLQQTPKSTQNTRVPSTCEMHVSRCDRAGEDEKFKTKPICCESLALCYVRAQAPSGFWRRSLGQDTFAGRSGHSTQKLQRLGATLNEQRTHTALFLLSNSPVSVPSAATAAASATATASIVSSTAAPAAAAPTPATGLRRLAAVALRAESVAVVVAAGARPEKLKQIKRRSGLRIDFFSIAKIKRSQHEGIPNPGTAVGCCAVQQPCSPQDTGLKQPLQPKSRLALPIRRKNSRCCICLLNIVNSSPPSW